MTPRRVLITGSRDWTDVDVIASVINALPPDTVIIHGACPRGADAIAHRLANARGLVVETWPADWRRYGAHAGIMRNQQMIDEGKPTDAHAFPLPWSRGTYDCMRRLRAAGVPLVVHEAE